MAILILRPLREAAGDLILYESNETQMAERIRDADIALLE